MTTLRDRDGDMRMDGALRCASVYLPEIAHARKRILEARILIARGRIAEGEAVLECEGVRLQCLLHEPRVES